MCENKDSHRCVFAPFCGGQRRASGLGYDEEFLYQPLSLNINHKPSTLDDVYYLSYALEKKNKNENNEKNDDNNENINEKDNVNKKSNLKKNKKVKFNNNIEELEEPIPNEMHKYCHLCKKQFDNY